MALAVEVRVTEDCSCTSRAPEQDALSGGTPFSLLRPLDYLLSTMEYQIYRVSEVSDGDNDDESSTCNTGKKIASADDFDILLYSCKSHYEK